MPACNMEGGGARGVRSRDVPRNDPMGAAATGERQRGGRGVPAACQTPSSSAALLSGEVIGGLLRQSHLRAAAGGHGRPSTLAARGSACGGGLPEAGAGGVLQRRRRGQVGWGGARWWGRGRGRGGRAEEAHRVDHRCDHVAAALRPFEFKPARQGRTATVKGAPRCRPLPRQLLAQHYE